MYAVIATGGKQYKVEEGQRLDVERLGSAMVKAKVVGDAKGPKIDGFTYKPKSNNRRRWGHRQKYTTIEITAISKG